MSVEIWLLFCTAASLNIISPGPAILLAVSNGVSSGVKAVVVGALGNVIGLFFISTISMFGLGVLLKTSAIFFTVLKFVGAAYLIYLGIKKFRHANRPLITDGVVEAAKTTYGKKFREAFLVAVTNPKAILFFVAFFPLFLTADSPLLPQFMIMTFSFMMLSFLSLLIYGYLARSVRHWFENVSFLKLFHRLTGGIFIGFGTALLQMKN